MKNLLIKDLEAILCGNVTIKQWDDETEDYKVLYSRTQNSIL